MPRCYSIVVAVDSQFGIGKSGTMPWKIAADLKRFKDITVKTKDATRKNAVIMGRKTWESVPPKFRPLPGRVNIIVSSTIKEPPSEGVIICGSLEESLELTATKLSKSIESVFIIGGSVVFGEALKSFPRLCQYIYLTKIKSEYNCDVFFPNVFDGADAEYVQDQTENEQKQEDGTVFQFLRYSRTNQEEQQYLDLVSKIIKEGVTKGDRTGVGTVSIFGAQMRFNLRQDVFPLLTSKRVPFRLVAEELLWFIRGDTNAKHLQEKDVHIWDGNASREFLDKNGLSHREVGDLGPVYGFQWRHFGAAYETMHSDYSGKGIDQLMNIIKTLRTNPNDRRIILTAWNPAALPEMALPPCHCFAQFYVANGELSCQMYQRSCDMGLGVPFNIASYALLTRMIAKVCGLKAGDFVHTLGDAHVYTNHIEPLKEQLKRRSRPFPTLTIHKETDDIEAIQWPDLEVLDYSPLPTIKMDMAV